MADEAAGGGEDYSAEDVAVDESPAYAGMAEVVELFNSYNSILDTTVEKLAAISSKLDEVLQKLSQIDTTGDSGGTSASGTPNAGGSAPGSEF